MHRVLRQPRLRALAVVVALGSFAVACGSDDDAGSADSVASDDTAAVDDTVAESSDGTAAVDNTVAPSDDTVAPSDDTAADAEPFEVTAAIGEQISRLDTQAAHTPINRFSTAFGNVGEALTTTDAEGKLVPLLAESWEQTGDRTWTFKLREGVTFTNGEPFDAAAAKFSLDRIASEEFGATHISFFTSYESSAAIDEHTFEVTSKEPDPDVPLWVAMAMVVPPAYTVDFKPDGPQETSPIGTGPYLFESKSADEVVLTKNPEYWGGEFDGPDRVTILSRPEASTRVAALQADEIDLIDSVPRQSIDQMPNVLPSTPARMLSLQLNQAQGITSDLRVRQAMMMAIDHAAMREALMGETAVTGQCQQVTEGILGFNPDLENLPYDPDAARALLEEAGVVGESIRFVVSAGVYPSGEEAAEVVASQLEAIGLEVDLQVVDRAAWRAASQAPVEERVEMFMGAASFDLGSVTQQYGPYILPTGVLTSIQYDEHPGLLESVTAALVEPDPELREEMLKQNQADLCEIVPYIPLWAFGNIVAYADDIEVPARIDQNFLWKDVRRAG